MKLRRWQAIALGAVGVALWIGLITTTTLAFLQYLDDEADDKATTAHADAAEAVASALDEYDAAATELADARDEALADRAATQALIDASDPAMLEDPATLDAVRADLTELASIAGIVTADDGSAALTPASPAPTPEIGAPPAGRDDRLAAAADLLDRAADVADETAALTDKADEVADAIAALDGSVGEVLDSAHTKGSALALPDLASAESKDAYTAAVAALVDPAADADLAALMTNYRTTWAGAVASHQQAETAAATPGTTPPPGATGAPTYINGILVVNKSYPLPPWYGNGLTAETSAAFAAMQAEAAGYGFSLYISSGFRSYDSQAAIYANYVARDGQAAADRYSARPGHSEHQSGLTFDLNCICQDFGYQADGQWVAANAHRFGFIVRYPPGKESITGYIWEPWHLRYLGVEAATAVYNSGLSLEEYLGITSVYAMSGAPAPAPASVALPWLALAARPEG